MKVALILPTAFIATLDTAPNYRQRIDQNLAGFKRVAEIVNKHKDIFDVYWVDNTVEEDKRYDPALMSAIKGLPNLKGEMGFSDNEYGKINKGSGIIAVWRRILPDAVQAGYDYVLHFEPRQEIVNISFFDLFASAPGSYFKVMTPTIRKWKIFRFKIDQFWTGLFTCSPKDLLAYAQSSDPKYLADKKISLETDLCRYFKEQGIQYTAVQSLGLRWHDVAHDDYYLI